MSADPGLDLRDFDGVGEETSRNDVKQESSRRADPFRASRDLVIDCCPGGLLLRKEAPV